MSLDLHRHAEAMMGEADALAASGKHEEAATLYREAAVSEANAFAQVPADRARTRGVIAISAIALYRKGGELDEAIRHAHAYLALPDLPVFAREEIEVLLDEIRIERRPGDPSAARERTA